MKRIIARSLLVSVLLISVSGCSLIRDHWELFKCETYPIFQCGE